MITARVLWTELRRGVAPLAFVGVAAIVTAVMFNELERWVGRWAELNAWPRVVLVVVGPVAVALGAWFGGRERRRGMHELLGSTPRTATHRTIVGWGSLTIGAAAGLALAWAVAAVLVVRIATYGGGPSWVTLAVAFLAVGTCVAVGYAIGGLAKAGIIGILAGAISGLATYALFGTVSYLDGGARWLVPSGDQLGGGRHLVGWAAAAQAVFFVAVGVAALSLVAARRRAWALVPLVIAVGAAYPLVRSDVDLVVVDDEAALALVCSGAAPQVCVERQLAFALADLEPMAREAMSTWNGVVSAPSRVTATRFNGSDGVGPASAGIAIERYLRWDGSLVRRGEWGEDLVMSIRSTPVPALDYDVCGLPDDDGSLDGLTWEEQDALWGTATMIVGGDPYNDRYSIDEDGDRIESPPYMDPLWDRVSTWNRSEQVVWFDTYATAAAECRMGDLAALARETVT